MSESRIPKEFVELAKHQKMAWVEATQRGDMPPTAIGILDGKPQLLVVADQVDKHKGLMAVSLMRRAMAIDEVVLIVDAHTTLTGGKSYEEQKLLVEKYASKPGSMQKACDEEGACSKGEIVDCVVLHYLDKAGKMTVCSYPYDYHGKDGNAFQWMEDETKEMGEYDENVSLGGFIVESIKEIMKHPTLFEDETIKQFAQMSGFGDMDTEEQRAKAIYHSGVAARRLFSDHNFIVMECLAYDGNYEKFFEQVAEKYTACARAYDGDWFFEHNEEGRASVLKKLDTLEEMAKERQDGELIERIKHMRAQFTQRSQPAAQPDPSVN